jgi:hypothetical protein
VKSGLTVIWAYLIFGEVLTPYTLQETDTNFNPLAG